MSGRVGELSAKQADSLTQFRYRIGDILPELPAQHDHYLLRWLRARSFSVPKAELMIRKHVEFRKNMKADTIISDWTPPEVITRYVSGGMCGHDKDGNPIWYDVLGPLDPKGLLMSASKQDFLRTKMRNMEMLQRECQKQSEKLGVNVESVTLIYDCEGLGFKHLWKPAIETYGEILTMFEDNYPEGLKRVFLIKAPKLFPMAYTLIKHFLSEETRHKLIILGGDWQEVLRKHVDAEQLPVVYGGTRTDPDGDPRCRTMINYGGIVPRSYYIQNSIKVQYDTSVTVSRGAVLQLDYHVTAPCSLLSSLAPREHKMPPKHYFYIKPQHTRYFCKLHATGGSSPATGPTSALGCTDARRRVTSRRWRTCCRWSPANVTMRTWCPRTI
ncbi:SEC14-like protein 2 isoform X3 [Hippocampus comes]|uniref:SEC14-like protein 2 isoform X3 n=1 Tax=Hippocampus comes TaxID=109280 RepID=UPI00094E9175|nr:PREDICTED: SEC14-like protein 2 isoform X3 [Hippocampus comes]